MNKPALYLILFLALTLLSACSAAEGVERAPVGTLTIPNTPVAGPATPLAGGSAASITPAPSGFVPGDALPTPIPAATPTRSEIAVVDGRQYRELSWEELVPPGYRPEDIMAKYQDELSAYQDGDPAAMELYQRMQEEFNNAPINSTLNRSDVRIPGFIAPLEYQDDLITEFLLVPYFGACIHVPPPPVNQTVHVTLAAGQGIPPEKSFYPVWVHGFMTTEGMNTDIGNAGYRMEDAVTQPYNYAQ